MTKRHPKPTPEQNVGRLMRKAAQVLSDRPWIKGTIGHQDKGMCLRGALAFTVIGKTSVLALDNLVELSPGLPGDPEEIFINWMLENREDFYFTSVPAWNDHKDTTKEEIILWMNKFADAVDPQRR